MTQTSGTRPFSPPVFIREIREKGLATRGYDYGALKTELIRDQLIKGTRYERVRTKLLMKDETLSLDGAFKLAMRMEEAA